MIKCDKCKFKDQIIIGPGACSSCLDNPKLESHFEPAEPKVLTADECLSNMGVLGMDARSSYKMGFAHGRKNGRLERDLELREFVDDMRGLHCQLLP